MLWKLFFRRSDMSIAAIFKQHGLEPEKLLHEAIRTSKAAGSVIMGYYEASS